MCFLDIHSSIFVLTVIVIINLILVFCWLVPQFPQRVKHLSKKQVVSVNPFNRVNNLYVIFDSELNLYVHCMYTYVSKTGFYHLKNIVRVHPFLSPANIEILILLSPVILTIVTLLSGLPERNISGFQLLQNSDADEDQKLGTYYTRFKITAVAPCVF